MAGPLRPSAGLETCRNRHLGPVPTSGHQCVTLVGHKSFRGRGFNLDRRGEEIPHKVAPLAPLPRRIRPDTALMNERTSATQNQVIQLLIPQLLRDRLKALRLGWDSPDYPADGPANRVRPTRVDVPLGLPATKP